MVEPEQNICDLELFDQHLHTHGGHRQRYSRGRRLEPYLPTLTLPVLYLDGVFHVHILRCPCNPTYAVTSKFATYINRPVLQQRSAYVQERLDKYTKLLDQYQKKMKPQPREI